MGEGCQSLHPRAENTASNLLAQDLHLDAEDKMRSRHWTATIVWLAEGLAPARIEYPIALYL